MTAAPTRLDRRRALGEAARRLRLLDWVPRATPRYQRPEHLAPLAELVERALAGEALRVVVSVPPRHGKSELETHAIAYALCRDPSTPQILACHTAGLAFKLSRRARSIATDAGVALESRSRNAWTTAAGGGVVACGVGAALPGHGGKLIWVDDPVPSRAAAESAHARDALEDWFTSSLMTRAEPGASVFVIMHRWHEDDIAGRLLKSGDGWIEVNLPALTADEDGAERALWPARYDVTALHRIRDRSERDWASLYQGRPRPADAQVFQGAHLYQSRPDPSTLRIAAGLDMAYSAKASGDWTVIVTVGFAHDGRCYVLEVQRVRQGVERTVDLLRAHRARWNVTPRWYAGGQERALAEMLRMHGVHLDVRPASADKVTRAQGLAAAWNRGEVLLEEGAAWLDPLLAEALEFPQSRNDDQIDALVAAFDAGQVSGGALSMPVRIDRGSRPYGPRGPRGPWSDRQPRLEVLGDRSRVVWPDGRKGEWR